MNATDNQESKHGRWILSGIAALALLLSGLSSAFSPIQAGGPRVFLASSSSSSSSSGGAFSMPIGVPDFPWDSEEAIPAVPDPWSSSTTGFYYVKQGGSAGDNGTPAAPRGTLPNMSTIPDGSVVVLDNTADFTGSSITINPVGIESAKIWFVGSNAVGLGSGSTKAVIRYTGDFSINCVWTVIDGIDFFNNSSSQTGWGMGLSNNCVIRNYVIRANGVDRSANSSNFIGGSSTSSRTQFIIFKGGQIHSLGDWQHEGGDIDCHGLQIGRWVDDLWIVDNEIYRNQGDGIQLTGDGNPNNNTPTVVQRVYIARNTMYENLQTGFWIKTGDVVIASENIVHDHIDGGGSAPVGMGGQYDFDNVWYLFNRLYDNGNGIRFASNNNGVNPTIRLIGNVITGSNGTGGTVQNSSAFSDGVGIGFWQGGSAIAVAFNTISGYAGHCITATNGSGNDIRFENNICRARDAYANASSRFDVLIESVTTQPKIRNNSFPANPRFSVNGSTTTTIATFHSGSSSNRSDNLGSAVSVVNDATGAAGDFHVDGDTTIGAGLVTTDLFAEYLSDYSIDIGVDFSGTERPQNGSYDLGAYEFAGPALEGTGLVFQFVGGGQATAPTNSFDTTTGGMRIAFVGRQDTDDFATGVVTDNQGNTLTYSGSFNTYGVLWPDSGTSYYFKANATGGTGTIVSDSKPTDSHEITVLALGVANADQIEDESFVYDTSGPTTTCTSITVTKPTLLYSAWAGDDSNGEANPQPAAGWTRQRFTNSTAGNHIQMALATKYVQAGTHGNVWTPNTSQGGHCYLGGVNLQ